MYDIHVGSAGQLGDGAINPSAVSRLLATRGRQAAASECGESEIVAADCERLGAISPLLVINTKYVSPPPLQASRFPLYAPVCCS